MSTATGEHTVGTAESQRADRSVVDCLGRPGAVSFGRFSDLHVA